MAHGAAERLHSIAPPRTGRLRVLLTTEGTYPYAVGGVSSWCELLLGRITEVDWQVLPIVAGERKAPAFRLPPHARQLGAIALWSETVPARLRRHERAGGLLGEDLPATLVRGLIGWRGDPAGVIDALVRCRRAPQEIRASFRSRASWKAFLDGLEDVLAERVPEAGTPPALDLVEAATLYQILYWVARTAAFPTPETDLLHATAAGWAAIPAIVHKAIHGTPMVLTEHGVYVREAYLAAARSTDGPGARFMSTRLARGLARCCYREADAVAPVTDANARWEQGLGVDPDRIEVIYNGLRAPEEPGPPPNTKTVVSVGRIDPLKDIHTMLRVAVETLRLVPDAQFLHFGPVTAGQEAYGRSCHALHEQLGLGDRFRFMGRTSDPNGVVRDADVMLMTSISEGMPMSILEAMGQGRPVVTTGVGGCADVVQGCGAVRAPGDVHGLAVAVAGLLRRPELAWSLGLRGHVRLRRVFNEESCVNGYRELLRRVATPLELAA